ncbi:hypothetical protein K491DRAFT_696897 [Lophiostoma macrostomum CBS 122681]|uniref:Uncharacterized protein n=1 Tax=Lophiostoma macrostomum CBS 122681 TaxID=1314788 RepID=A0A6A6SWB6_9PLEO|nr:hypothetical protein K491DRAFT_696897 [Lophiostoma macrostomum CBS 122681]
MHSPTLEPSHTTLTNSPESCAASHHYTVMLSAPYRVPTTPFQLPNESTSNLTQPNAIPPPTSPSHASLLRSGLKFQTQQSNLKHTHTHTILPKKTHNPKSGPPRYRFASSITK